MITHQDIQDVCDALIAKRRKAAGWYTLQALKNIDSNAMFKQFSRNASRITLGEADHRLDAIIAEQAEYDAK